VALLVAVLSFVLLGLTAFVTDFGLAYAKQRLVQNGADAAALASARKIAGAADKNVTCSSLETAYPPAAVETLAQATFDMNAPSADITEASVSCETLPGFAKPQLVVTVGGRQETPSFFGQIFGADPPEVNRVARVIMGNALPYGLRPFGLCGVDAAALATKVGGVYVPKTVVFPATSDAKDEEKWGCGSASGNAGLLDLDAGGGGRGAGPTGCEGIKGWIKCGFNGTLPNPSSIPGQSGGIGGDLDAAMSTLKDKDIALPVYTDVTGNGSATYQVTGFVVVTVCGWDFQTKPSVAMGGATTTHQYGCYNDTEWKTASTTAKTTWGDNKIEFLQLKYVKSVTVGELNGNCALGDATCDWGTRAAWLAD
jgi:hypothetical protein